MHFFAKEYQEQNGLRIVLADIEFGDKLVLNLGDLTAILFHTISPHSEDTVCIYIPEEQVLFLGDSTSEDFFDQAYLDQVKLRSLIQVIEDTSCAYCVLSHAEPLRKAELLAYLYTVIGS